LENLVAVPITSLVAAAVAVKIAVLAALKD
jgi:hypothetical protein